MLRATCHCQAVAVEIPRPPEAVTNCNCSVCRRYGALWGYFDAGEVKVHAPPGSTDEYRHGPQTLAFVRCRHCGCITHWRPLAGKRKTPRMGVNIRLFEPEQIGPVRVRLLDGAVTEAFVGEFGPV